MNLYCFIIIINIYIIFIATKRLHKYTATDK